MSDHARTPIGIWIESPRGAQWANQGMTRLLGFIVEGLAQAGSHVFRIVVTDDIRSEAEADFADLVATAGEDYSFHSPQDMGQTAADFDDLARFADRHVPVTAWISLFPNQLGIKLLSKPVASIFPDAIGLAYHDFTEGAWALDGPPAAWRDRVSQALPHITRFITFSDHVARDQVQGLFGVPPDRVTVIPHAPPTLDGILPFIRDGQRTEASRYAAACLLRRHAARHGPAYLANFPFEHVRYAAVSTQDRVTKNIRVVVDAIDELVRAQFESFKLIMTAQLHYGATWSPTPGAIARRLLHLDALSMPDLPRDVHAAFYHCAEIAIHPSVFEGGRGTFPYYEAISVGTPCLMAHGPHVAELLIDTPELAGSMFDPFDAVGLAALMLAASAGRAELVALQRATYDRLRQRTWRQVALEYAAAALAPASTGISATTLPVSARISA
ncbi:hypothetical protein [Sandarakinorhabdus sp.]|uniref:hypothetical protein n=1 Tax=Sandarakinorhabdus sp. TaxID=1916663 RepID=UPI003340A206